MIPLLHDNICTIFLHSWLNRNGYSLDQLESHLVKSRWSYSIKNTFITDKLEKDYLRYQKSGQTLDDFFDRQINANPVVNLTESVERYVHLPFLLYKLLILPSFNVFFNRSPQ